MRRPRPHPRQTRPDPSSDRNSSLSLSASHYLHLLPFPVPNCGVKGYRSFVEACLDLEILLQLGAASRLPPRTQALRQNFLQTYVALKRAVEGGDSSTQQLPRLIVSIQEACNSTQTLVDAVCSPILPSHQFLGHLRRIEFQRRRDVLRRSIEVLLRPLHCPDGVGSHRIKWIQLPDTCLVTAPVDSHDHVLQSRRYCCRTGNRLFVSSPALCQDGRLADQGHRKAW